MFRDSLGFYEKVIILLIVLGLGIVNHNLVLKKKESITHFDKSLEDNNGSAKHDLIPHKVNLK